MNHFKGRRCRHTIQPSISSCVFPSLSSPLLAFSKLLHSHLIAFHFHGHRHLSLPALACIEEWAPLGQILPIFSFEGWHLIPHVQLLLYQFSPLITLSDLKMRSLGMKIFSTCPAAKGKWFLIQSLIRHRYNQNHSHNLSLLPTTLWD